MCQSCTIRGVTTTMILHLLHLPLRLLHLLRLLRRRIPHLHATRTLQTQSHVLPVLLRLLHLLRLLQLLSLARPRTSKLTVMAVSGPILRCLESISQLVRRVSRAR